MLDLFVSAFVLGLIFNAAPGAILTESIRRGLNGGFSPALAVQIGSLVGDALWVVLGLLGAATLILVPYVHIPLAIAGAGLLVWLAIQSFKDTFAEMPAFANQDARGQGQTALLTGVALSIGNPLNITYWAALGGVISSLSGEHPDWRHFAVFVGGFMTSSVLWCFFAAAVISVTRRNLSPGLWQGLHLICGVGLLIFAAATIHGLITMP